MAYFHWRWAVSRLIPRSATLLSAAKRNIVNEHFVPAPETTIDDYLLAENTLGVHSLIRYQWAIRVLNDFSQIECVLDVGCGSGFGTAAVAKAFPNTEIIGVDHDPAAIEHARKHFKSDNASFLLGEAMRLEELLGNHKFDGIISFETFEHISHREIVLESFVRLLKEDGRLLFSTPCDGTGLNSLTPDWEHHKIEYSAVSLYDFLGRYFRKILRPEDGSLPHVNIFRELAISRTKYPLIMNPLLCADPIIVKNPFL
jgi:2-polyprenyl-3-methyl-5-hydroxy-6-metoxy-1,4-benzoquinol methylase